MKYIIPLCIIFIVGCSLFSTTIAKKGISYLIKSSDSEYVFIVLNIKSEESENILIESIEYQLYSKEKINDAIYSTFIKYQSKKNGEHSYELKRLDGTDMIEFENLSFSWSYGSNDYIYLYLKEGVSINKL